MINYKMTQKTLVLVKPDGVKRGLIGEIVKRFEDRGLKICGIKMHQVTPEFSKLHYSSHIEKPFYPALEKYITETPVVALVVHGAKAVEVVRKLVGPTAPSEAMPGTIRGDFAHQYKEYANKKGFAIKNLIHASGTSEEAEKEIKLWFTDEELHDYKVSHEDEVL